MHWDHTYHLHVFRTQSNNKQPTKNIQQYHRTWLFFLKSLNAFQSLDIFCFLVISLTLTHGFGRVVLFCTSKYSNQQCCCPVMWAKLNFLYQCLWSCSLWGQWMWVVWVHFFLLSFQRKFLFTPTRPHPCCIMFIRISLFLLQPQHWLRQSWFALRPPSLNFQPHYFLNLPVVCIWYLQRVYILNRFLIHGVLKAFLCTLSRTLWSQTLPRIVLKH